MRATNHISALHAILAFLAVGISSATAQVAKPISSLPYTITKPGRYLVLKDLVLTKVATAAITIAADDVQLDLGGRLLTTTLPTTTEVKGIESSLHQGISVFNGRIRGFTQGMRLNCFSTTTGEVSVENVRVTGSTQNGIDALGTTVTVRNCVVVNIGGATAPFATGLSVDALFATVVGNEVLNTTTQFHDSDGIHVGAASGVVEKNRVLNDPGNHGGSGLFTGGGYTFFDSNQIIGFGKGIFINGNNSKYRNNSTADCTTPYVGGVDAGNNK